MGNAEERLEEAIKLEKRGDTLVDVSQGFAGDAIIWYRKSKELYVQLVKDGCKAVHPVDLARIYNKFAQSCSDSDIDDEAWEYFNKALEIRKQLAEETGTVEALCDLYESYSSIGRFCSIWNNKYEEAIIFYKKCLEIQRQILTVSSDTKVRTDMADVCDKLAFLVEKYGDPSEMQPLYEEAMKIREELLDEIGAEEIGQDLMYSYDRFRDICKCNHDYELAAEYVQKKIRILEWLKAYDEPEDTEEDDELEDEYDDSEDTEEDDELEDEYDDLEDTEEDEELADAYDELGDIYRDEGRTDLAEIYYLKSLNIRRELAAEESYSEWEDADRESDLAMSLYNVGAVTDDRAMLMEAYEIFNRIAVNEHATGQRLAVAMLEKIKALLGSEE